MSHSLKFVFLSLVLANLVYISLQLPSHYTAAENKEWDDYKTKFNKKYNEPDDKNHKDIYFTNKKEIEAHNKLFKEGKVDYELKINQFADRAQNQAPKGLVPDAPGRGKPKHGGRH